jgi:hypothetical protein
MYFTHFKFPSSLLHSFPFYLHFPLRYLYYNLVYMPFARHTNQLVTEVSKRVKKIRYVKRKTGITREMLVFRF